MKKEMYQNKISFFFLLKTIEIIVSSLIKTSVAALGILSGVSLDKVEFTLPEVAVVQCSYTWIAFYKLKSILLKIDWSLEVKSNLNIYFFLCWLSFRLPHLLTYSSIITFTVYLRNFYLLSILGMLHICTPQTFRSKRMFTINNVACMHTTNI